MNLPLLLPIFTTFFFGVLCIYLSIKQDRTASLLVSKERKQRQRMYELALLKEIQDRIGYSFDIEKVIDVISGSLRTLLPYSTVSSLLITNNHYVCKHYLEESVSHSYLSEVKLGMLASVNAITRQTHHTEVMDLISGMVIDDTSHKPVGAIFHIPLIVNEKLQGVITISSTKPNIYHPEDIQTIYRITNQAIGALERLESVLKTEKEKLVAMITSLVDGVFMVDMNSKLLVINPAARKFLGLHADQPTIIDILTTMPSSFNFGSKMQQALLQNKTLFEKEVQIGTKIFEVYITPVVNPHYHRSDRFHPHRVIGASILLHDITVERSVSKMKEDFTNIMVHELRSPLTAIKASSQLLVSQADKIKPEEQTKLLQLISTQAQKLLEEIGLILDAAKLDAGMFTVSKVKTDIGKLINEKVLFFQPEAENKHISLTATGQENLPEIMVDPIHMSQVLNNLLSNSLKFTPIGGKITISASTTPDQMLISVTDNGMGIPKEKQSSLFERFSQISTPNAHVGTGLGLYIVKGIIEAHGGHVSLISDGHSGTTISCALPLVATSPASAQNTPAPPLHALSN